MTPQKNLGKKKDHNMSKFTHKVEILGLLAFFVSDFLGSSRLPSIIFFPPNFCVHNPSMTCKWLHKNSWEKKTDHNMSKITPEVEILCLLAFFVSVFFYSSRLHSIIFFVPILVCMIIHLANDEPTKKKIIFFDRNEVVFMLLWWFRHSYTCFLLY